MDVLLDQIKVAGAAVAAKKKANEDFAVELAELKRLKGELAALEKEANAAQREIDALRAGVEGLCLRKFFYVPSFELHGPTAGFFDFGPPGCAVKANIINAWKQHFILTERMLQVDCVNVCPRPVLKASGHVDRFCDFMVTDTKTGEYSRADKLLEQHVDNIMNDIKQSAVLPAERKDELQKIRAQADAYTQEELAQVLEKEQVLSPEGNPITAPFPFNLMFTTSIGPSGKSVGYLRPETAQGIFTNFKRLLDYNKGKVPFAAAQIGLAFRNEISPQGGLLRVREFPMAEIEHFVHPEYKNHAKFKNVREEKLTLFSADSQLGDNKTLDITVGEAVEKNIINNETLGYFIARTQQFLLKIGVNREKLRFRQHLSTEMAHYASDCWDAEIHTTFGWIECVGHADRGAYDLDAHAVATNTELVATFDFKEPKVIQVPVFSLNAREIGKAFGKSQKPLKEWLTKGIKADEAKEMWAALENGQEVTKTVSNVEYKLTPGMITGVKWKDKRIQQEKFLPSVIEPSFGIGRILYAVIEHAFTVRKKEDGSTEDYLAFNPLVAPVKVVVCTQSPKPELQHFLHDLSDAAIALNLPYDQDDTKGSIGKKYARADEIGIPYAICIDFETPNDKQVTLRERDSTKQVRLPVADVMRVVFDCIHGQKTWAQVMTEYPEFGRPDESKKN